MKKIIIFGATGTIGTLLVAQALKNGYQVTAFTRKKENVNQTHQHLKSIEGDVLDLISVEKAIHNQDVVLCCLGAGRKGIVRSKGTENIIKAMQNIGLKRFICQTSLGVGDSVANLNFFWKYIMFGWFLKEAHKDHELQEDHIFKSALDWTLIRPAAFTNGKLTKNYNHGFKPTNKNLALKISRSDVAHFMLQQIDNEKYIHQTPGVSY